MKTEKRGILEEMNIFSHSEPPALFSKDNTEQENAYLYSQELKNYISELDIIYSRIYKRSRLLTNSYERISYISSSKDPMLLRELLGMKILILIERKNNLLDEISRSKTALEQQIVSVSEIELYSLDSSSLEDLNLQRLSLHSKILIHYSKYNKILSEIKYLIKTQNITNEDKNLILNIIFPCSTTDKLPIITSIIRKIFGTRVVTAGSFFKEIWLISSKNNICITESSDKLDIISCYLHFIRNRLIKTSSLLFGCISMIVLSSWCLIAFTESIGVSSSISILFLPVFILFLILWCIFGLGSFISAWVLGYPMVSNNRKIRFLNLTDIQLLIVFPIYALNILTSTFISVIFVILLNILLSQLDLLIGSNIFYLIGQIFSLYVGYLSVCSSFHSVKNTRGKSISRLLSIFILSLSFSLSMCSLSLIINTIMMLVLYC